jgi:hypothetical protein
MSFVRLVVGCSTALSVRPAQALLFLSLEGLGQDGTLTVQELPPRPGPPGRRSDEGSSGGVSGSGGGSSSSSTSSKDGGVSDNTLGSGLLNARSDGSSGSSGGSDGSGGGLIQWCHVPPSYGDGVLGYGISGEVLAGR